MIPPRHGVHEQTTGIAEGMSLAIYAPVMHETGVANRSPRNERGNAIQLVVDHFAETQDGDRIRFGFTAPGDAHD